MIKFRWYRYFKVLCGWSSYTKESDDGVKSYILVKSGCPECLTAKYVRDGWTKEFYI